MLLALLIYSAVALLDLILIIRMGIANSISAARPIFTLNMGYATLSLVVLLVIITYISVSL